LLFTINFEDLNIFFVSIVDVMDSVDRDVVVLVLYIDIIFLEIMEVVVVFMTICVDPNPFHLEIAVIYKIEKIHP